MLVLLASTGCHSLCKGILGLETHSQNVDLSLCVQILLGSPVGRRHEAPTSVSRQWTQAIHPDSDCPASYTLATLMLLPRSSSSRGRGTKGYNEKAVTDIFNEMLSPADEDREVESFRRINRSHLSCGVGILWAIAHLLLLFCVQCLTSEGIINLASSIGITDMSVSLITVAEMIFCLWVQTHQSCACAGCASACIDVEAWL